MEPSVGKILLIDDDPFQCAAIESIIKKMGYDCHCVYSGIEGFTLLKTSHFDIIFLDLNLHEGSGLMHIPRLTELNPEVDIVMLTGESDSDCISEAFAAGVKDYLVKPIKEERFRTVIQNLLRHKAHQKNEAGSLVREEIIGDSTALNECLERLAIAAKASGNVLITGETGTGKELFARALHINSDRKDNRYIVVDCTNLPSTLAESLLFGHAKGSFTGADQDRKGLFHLAHGGTLFLDEIGDLDLGIQKSLLRVLQEKTFRPLSSSKEVYSDFRLVAATNRNLEEMVERGEFRSDLYYRLQTNIIELPPLRERDGDVELLTRHYLPILCNENDMEEKEVDPQFIDTLQLYDWPGNVRELVNVLHVSLQKARFSNYLNIYHLPQQLRMRRVFEDMGENEESVQECPVAPSPYYLPSAPEEFPAMKAARQEAVDAMEQAYLHRLVQLSDASVAMACKLSGLSRARLYELLSKHNLSLKKS
ncbi:sigma-54 dependent transcriptional regulator [Pseudodesulfovibrio thermohalotolerans]|uniref:sigma-54-dependent transcriptional regulator n=1 Tax=Pseudodesulfovibrio thermohalotolerans TaxID=2880651 RepID=UPI0024417BC1|nr:sigma-54 dependent transcriptional regulator [Pseudodesulfovibrio thermohalotolerans]WFS61619.1 sigma-54 dependent transcriptional regulator [Pseudodesulfovibrio thermohalotolerans]